MWDRPFQNISGIKTFTSVCDDSQDIAGLLFGCNDILLGYVVVLRIKK